MCCYQNYGRGAWRGNLSFTSRDVITVASNLWCLGYFLSQKFLHFHDCHSSAYTCLREGPKVDTVIKKRWCVCTRFGIICCIGYT